jgi:hypothetical protein
VPHNKRHGFVGYVRFVGLAGLLNRLTDLTDLTVITGLTLLLAVTSHAATFTVTSCAQADIQTAINSAGNGDTVIVPAGVCSWSSPVTITNKSITLQGAGHGCNPALTPNGHAPAACTGSATNISVNSAVGIQATDDTQPFRITGFRFNRNSQDTATILVTKSNGSLDSKNAVPWRIDHCYFNGNARHVSINGARNFGLVDNSLFYVPGGAQIFLFWGRGAGEQEATSNLSLLSGNVAHSDPLRLGTADALYVEDCEFYTDVWQGGQNIGDGTAGQRMVIRHNVVRGQMIENHGACSGAARGSYSFEIYDNDIYPYDWNGTAGTQWAGVRLRGGTGVIFNNRFWGNWDPSAGEIYFDNQRSEPATVSGGECGVPVNTVCDGSRAIDTNSVTGRPVALCLDQIGAGSGAIDSQQADPAYTWNNTRRPSGAAVNPRVDPDNFNSTYIQLSRDYFTTVKPGYNAYPYPHPLIAATLPPPANTFYIRDGGTSTTCLDWTNACDALPATLQRGATYYVADGAYPSYTFDDPESGGQLIVIKKATALDHGTDSGWANSYGDGQAVFDSVLKFERGDYRFDGQVRSESNWFDGAAYGFEVTHNNQDENIVIRNDTRAVNKIAIRYVYVNAIVGNLGATTIRRYAVDTDTFGGPNNSGLVFHRMFVNGSNNVWFIRSSEGTLIEYCASSGATGNDANHGEIVNLYFNAENSIIRHNQFRNAYQDGGGTALIAIADERGTSTPPKTEIYGNLFWNYKTSDGTIGFTGNPSNGGNCTNCVVVNNTFVDGQGGWGIQFPDGSGNTVRNNLFLSNGGSPATDIAIGAGGINSHNAFGTASGSSGSSSQAGLPSSIFVNYANGDFKLASATNAGATLAFPYNVDLLGNIRGADGVWDRGALEYVGGGHSACNLNGDSATNVSDVQLCVNQAIGTSACSTGDINSDGACNVVDVQRVVNGALGGPCVTQ